MATKLPAYYEKYFDEKFDHVNERFDKVEKHIEKINGSVSDNRERSQDNARKIKMIITAIVGGSFVLIKESRDAIMYIVKSLLAI